MAAGTPHLWGILALPFLNERRVCPGSEERGNLGHSLSSTRDSTGCTQLTRQPARGAFVCALQTALHSGRTEPEEAKRPPSTTFFPSVQRIGGRAQLSDCYFLSPELTRTNSILDRPSSAYPFLFLFVLFPCFSLTFATCCSAHLPPTWSLSCELNLDRWFACPAVRSSRD